MRVIEPGHIYEVDQLDAPVDSEPQIIEFVNREPGTQHPGTQTQELLRVLIDVLNVTIDRTNHCDDCIRWEGNDRIIKAMSEAQRQIRLAILFHEQRVLERKFDKGDIRPEKVPLGADGHYDILKYCTVNVTRGTCGKCGHTNTNGDMQKCQKCGALWH